MTSIDHKRLDKIVADARKAADQCRDDILQHDDRPRGDVRGLRGPGPALVSGAGPRATRRAGPGRESRGHSNR